MNAHSRSRRGWTLVELSVVVLLVGLAGGALAPLLLSGTRVFSAGTANNLGQQRLALGMQSATRELREAALLSVSPILVHYHVPVDAEGDGNVLDQGGVVQMGANGVRDQSIVLYYVQERLFSEAAEKMDLNRDGDLSDVFSVGRLERNLQDETGLNIETRVIAKEVVLSSPTPGVDIDGDGQADPVFQTVNEAGEPEPQGRRLRIKLFVLHRNAGGELSLSCLSTAISPRSRF